MARLSRKHAPLDPLAQLKPDSLEAFARLLRLPPSKGELPTTKWLEKQKATIVKLGPELRRQATLANFLRLARLGPALCTAHKGLNEALVWWCYQQLRNECSVCLTRLVAYRDKLATAEPVELDKFLDRLVGLQSLYLSNFDDYFAVPDTCRFAHLPSGCPACVLAIVGARPVLLVALRANMLARTRHRSPRLLRLVDAWVAESGDLPVRQRMLFDSDGMAARLRQIRHFVSQRRHERIANESARKKKARADRERERMREGRKSSSHRDGEPFDLRRDEKTGAPLPSPGRGYRAKQEVVTPSLLSPAPDTLFERLQADACVTPGPNPVVFPGFQFDERGHAEAHGYDTEPERENEPMRQPTPANSRAARSAAGGSSRASKRRNSPHPGTPSGVSEYIPARRNWPAARDSTADWVTEQCTQADVLDLSDAEDDDDDDDLDEDEAYNAADWTSAVETTLTRPATNMPPRSAPSVARTYVSRRIARPPSSNYSAPRQAPSTVAYGPSSPAFPSPYARPAAPLGHRNDANTTPSEYIRVYADVAERFGMNAGSVLYADTVVPDDSVSVALPRRVREAAGQRREGGVPKAPSSFALDDWVDLYRAAR